MNILASGASVKAEIQTEQLMAYLAQDQVQTGPLWLMIPLGFPLLVVALDTRVALCKQ